LIAGMVAGVAVFSLPFFYCLSYYHEIEAVLISEAEINGRLASQIIDANPTLWRFQQPKLEEFLRRRPSGGIPEVRRIVDLRGVVIAEAADRISAPILWRSVAIQDSGVAVGWLTIGRSLRPLVFQTGAVAVLGLLLGGGALVVLRVFPIRALDKILAENRGLLESLDLRVNELTSAESRLKFLYEVSSAINSTLDLREVLRLLVARVGSFWPNAAVQVWLVNPQSNEIELAVCGNVDQAEWKAEASYAPPLVQQVVSTKTSVSVLSIETDSRIPNRKSFLRQGLTSYFAFPLIAHEMALGAVIVLTREGQRMEDEDNQLLRTIANHAASAIHNSQVHETAQSTAKQLAKSNQSLDRLLAEQSGLYTVLAPLSREETFNEILNHALERLIRATGADAALMRLHDSKTGNLVRWVQHGYPENYLGGRSIGFSSRTVLETGLPLIVPDIAADPRMQSKLQLTAGFHSCAFLSLKIQDHVRGILQLSSRAPGYFEEKQRDHLMAIARQIGIAIENKELFEEVEASKAELLRSNRELEQFAYVASHDLQEPLRMITAYTKLLAKRYAGKLDKDADEFIHYAVDGAQRMQGLIQDLLAFSRVGTRGKEFAPTDCETVLSKALANLQAAIKDSIATVTRDPLPTLMADASQLCQVFQNLIDNAIKYQNAKPPLIHVSCQRRSNEWLFSVKDNGIGVDPKYADRIFVIFQRLHTRREYPGSGIGLALCKKIVERHDGRIWVESEKDQGSTFYFTIPAVADRSAANHSEATA
jgi:signal transduction histidine kinase